MRLIDADTLLDGEQTIPCPDVPFDTLGKMVDWFIKLIDKQPTILAPRWVRCEEGKPKDRDYYFAFTADAEAFVGEYIPSVDQWWNGDDLILTVTHWMPIEPPKEGV